ncbi:hypothetical protein WM00_17650 [Burkholderia cepacia]|nr:hypothetical protein WM00_17650 [Burkholderia cepacia]
MVVQAAADQQQRDGNLDSVTSFGRLMRLASRKLSDVETDVSVAVRHLGIADASFVLLQRARDRISLRKGRAGRNSSDG